MSTDKLMAHQLGQLNELRTATEMTAQGAEVFMPIGAQTKADMVVVYNGKALKVQVKTATEQTLNGCTFHQCRLDNSRGRKYVEGDFDILIVAINKGELLAFSWEEVANKSSMCVGNRNKGRTIADFLKDIP